MTEGKELLSATKTDREIIAMAKREAIRVALIFTKWNDAPNAYRVLAVWAKAHGENPRFIATLDIRPNAGHHGAASLIVQAHNRRRDPEILAVLGYDWTDNWTQ